MASITEFLGNALGGLAINLGVSGTVGSIMGVGATLAFHPVLLLGGVLVGGVGIAAIRALLTRADIYIVEEW
ncbi:MAG: hypothetical protein KME64_41510 [Scytonematopsis contorta HA4267-MV1]|jgi:hypothetical protein|nr:hypothetical protein [Scytonematopsis contorta HA4267-MV1]